MAGINRIWNILDMVRKGRRNMSMRIGEYSFTRLYFFLKGCQTCAEVYEEEKFEFLAGFDEFVHNQYPESKEEGYYKIIRSVSTDEEDAIDKFNNLLDDFLKIQPPEIGHLYEKQEVMFLELTPEQEQKAMDDMWKLFYEIKENPEKYLGKPSLKLLDSFLFGVIYYMDPYYFLAGMHKYVRIKYQDLSDYGVAGIVRNVCESDEEAFYKFYDLAEEFSEAEKTDPKVAKYKEDPLAKDIDWEGFYKFNELEKEFPGEKDKC